MKIDGVDMTHSQALRHIRSKKSKQIKKDEGTVGREVYYFLGPNRNMVDGKIIKENKNSYIVYGYNRNVDESNEFFEKEVRKKNVLFNK